jgi:hypothetical protein
MARVLTNSEWKRLDAGMGDPSRPPVVNVKKCVNWFFTHAFHRHGPMKGPLAALKTLWLVVPEKFLISPIHAADNHISVRVAYACGVFDTFHIYIVPGTHLVSHATTTVKNEDGSYDFSLLWRNDKLNELSGA